MSINMHCAALLVIPYTKIIMGYPLTIFSVYVDPRPCNCTICTAINPNIRKGRRKWRKYNLVIAAWPTLLPPIINIFTLFIIIRLVITVPPQNDICPHAIV